MYLFEHSYENDITRGFNLQKCQTKKPVSLKIREQVDPYEAYAKKALYKIDYTKQSCNSAFLLYKENLVFTFSDCEPYRPAVKANIRIDQSEKIES